MQTHSPITSHGFELKFENKTPEEIEAGKLVIFEQRAEQEFRTGEYWGHVLPYQTGWIDLQVIEQFDQTYTLHKVQIPNQPDIVCYILEPQNDHEIIVSFRGTKTFGSLIRDLDPQGAGHQSIYASMEFIFKKLNSVLGRVTYRAQGAATIVIAGHSLGGADAQNFTVALMETVKNWITPNAESDIEIHFNKIKKICLKTYNSTGIHSSSEELAAETAGILARRGIQLEAYFFLVAGDAVQQTGLTNIFSTASFNHVRIHLLKVYHKNVIDRTWDSSLNPFKMLNRIYPSLMSAVTAHTAQFFNPNKPENIDGKPPEYYFNFVKGHEAIIRKKLMKKDTKLNGAVINSIQSAIHQVPQFLEWVKSFISTPTGLILPSRDFEPGVLVEEEKQVPARIQECAVVKEFKEIEKAVVIDETLEAPEISHTLRAELPFSFLTEQAQ